MKHNRVLPDLLLEVPTQLLLISGWTLQKRRINHKILTSEVFVYGRPHPDGYKNPLSCPPSTLMTFWEPFFASYGGEWGEEERYHI